VKILFVSTFFDPDNVGGAELALRNLARGLRERGHAITVLCTAPSGPVREQFQDGLNVLRVGIANRYWPDPGDPQPLWRRLLWHAADVYNRAAHQAIADAITRTRPDVVCTQNLAGFSVAAWDAARALGVPVVHVLNDLYLLAPSHRSYEHPLLYFLSRLFRLQHRRASKEVDAVVALSRSVLEEHRRAGYFAGVQTTLIPTALPLPDPGPGSRGAASAPLRIGFLARLVPAKGIELLLEAFTRLPALDAVLLVGGVGSARYVARLHREYADSRIRFLGFVDSPTFFRDLDVCVVPSIHHDCLPTVVIEASANRVPVIGARVGGIPELICAGENGFVFELRTRSQMCQALEFACAHRNQLAAMRESARAAIAPLLDHPRQLARYEAVLESAMMRSHRLAIDRGIGGGRVSLS
jgi:glycosyltransferase involved in cell wall biosynthesis